MRALLVSVLVLFAAAVAADAPVRSPRDAKLAPTFDIVVSRVQVLGDRLVFTQTLAGAAGIGKPTPAGQLAGAPVYSYVWPTSLDSATVGFAQGQGILALAVTVHPDFDDTPLYDENGDGDGNNDGDEWHSHWVVLVEDAACGEGGMKVRDIPEGTSPRLPSTWPGLALLIDSPDYVPTLDGPTVTVRLPLADVGAPANFRYDGVTSSLRVNANLHDPLLCIERVFDVASGDLSLPGRLETNRKGSP